MMRKLLSVTASILVMSSALVTVNAAVAPSEAEAAGEGLMPWSPPLISGASMKRAPRCVLIESQPDQRIIGYSSDDPPSPIYDSHWIHTYECRWVEERTDPGQIVFEKRPEWTATVFMGDAVIRDTPRFYVDWWVQQTHVEDNGSRPDIDVFPDARGAWHPRWACGYKAMNGDARVMVENGVEVDRIDWAKYAFYNATYRWEQHSARFRHSTRTGGVWSINTPQDFIMAYWQGDNPYSEIDYTHCAGAGGFGGGPPDDPGIIPTILCPVRIRNVVVRGPQNGGSTGLPARETMDGWNPNTVYSERSLEGGFISDFGEKWAVGDYSSAVTDSGGAMSYIREVRNCRNADNMAQIDLQLRSPGNYTLDGDIEFVRCSYNIHSGFDNPTFFGGCTDDIVDTRPVSHPFTVGCSGNVVQGWANDNFNPARCFIPQCVWNRANTDNNTLILRNDPNSPNRLLRDRVRNPQGASVFADGTPVVWDASLTRMILRNVAGSVATPVPGTRYSVYQVSPESTPWNPNVPRGEPNSPDQWFSTSFVDRSPPGGEGVLSVVPPGRAPEDGPRRIAQWDEMRMSAYMPSESGDPMRIRVHRMESHRGVMNFGTVVGIGEYGILPGDPYQRTVQFVARCSTQWGSAHYVGKRFTPTQPYAPSLEGTD